MFGSRFVFNFEFCSKFKSMLKKEKKKKHCCPKILLLLLLLFVLFMPHDLFTIYMYWIVTLLSIGLNRFSSWIIVRCSIRPFCVLRLISMNQVKINWAFVKPITHHLVKRDYWLSIQNVIMLDLKYSFRERRRNAEIVVYFFYFVSINANIVEISWESRLMQIIDVVHRDSWNWKLKFLQKMHFRLSWEINVFHDKNFIMK